ncbi:MAG TPA: hypothetical protein VME63_01370 [Dyella sp.]|uniref:hypothetical protein n=1 Tax=Dyella sp. TaxID=1869338 RepID=UPI002C9C2E0F|nr:hypothetical protein [Dyella sp.]HTV84025.1 hypothetical protein [Dyella sp.]
MPVYSIEMGQGVIARATELAVITTALYSCTFIAGINATVGYAGAFHYPALALLTFGEQVHASTLGSRTYQALMAQRQDIKSDMLDWLRTLRPTEIVFASGKLRASYDLSRLEQWCTAHNPGLIYDFQIQTSAAMVATDKGMEVGKHTDLESRYRDLFKAEHYNLHSSNAGNYNGYFLFGRKR